MKRSGIEVHFHESNVKTGGSRMDELIEQKAVSEEIEETIGCELAGDIHTTKYGEYKVISTFSDTGESIMDLLSAYIDRVASLKY